MPSIQQRVPLRDYNTLALPSTAEFFCEISSEVELCEALAWARQKKLAVTMLGGGSNVVLAADIAGLVIHIAIPGIQLMPDNNSLVKSERIVRVGAGENWHQLVLHTLDQGWFGLENLSLIHGLAGAAPIQNIGAYGVELSDRFYSLEAIEVATGERVTMTHSDCRFGYRDSMFKGEGRDCYAITAINLKLSSDESLCLDYPALTHYLRDHEADTASDDPITPKRVSDAICAIRRSKLPDPQNIPNAGSFFKNPVISAEQMNRLQQQYPSLVGHKQANGGYKVAAGWLVEQAGWKGIERAGVGVHDKQALVLVNYRGTGRELLSLADDIKVSIVEKFGIHLEVEPRIYS
jgi:UDP-N-acetylmuramate dehydrogenase